MKRSTLLGVVVALAAGAAVLLLWPKEQLSPEQLIERKVLLMAEAAEKKDLGFVMDQISERFKGTSYALTKDTLKQLLAGFMMQGAWVKVFVRDQEVELTGARSAKYAGKFIFGRAPSDSIETLAAQSHVQAYRITGTLEQEEDGEWRFVTGGYEVLPPGQIF